MAAPNGSTGSSSTWVSSLGNTFGATATAPAVTPGIASATSSSFSSFSSPFASNHTTTAVPAIGTREDKNSMMAAFSDLGLALGADGSVMATSSSKALLAKKTLEKQQEEQGLAEHRARREARLQAKETAPASALMQAIDAFAGEVSQSDTYSTSMSRKVSGAGAASNMSRRARQKHEKAQDRAESYNGRRGAKSVTDIKRHQRREKYRHVY